MENEKQFHLIAIIIFDDRLVVVNYSIKHTTVITL